MAPNRTWAVALIGGVASAAIFVAGHAASRLGGSAPASLGQGTQPMIDALQPPRKAEDVACLLTPAQRDTQRGQLIPGLVKQTESVEDMPDGIRFRFAQRPQWVSELAALIEKERVCWSFLGFRLVAEKGTGPVTSRRAGPTGSAEMLRKLRCTPDRRVRTENAVTSRSASSRRFSPAILTLELG